jgi:hypothetical protein
MHLEKKHRAIARKLRDIAKYMLHIAKYMRVSDIRCLFQAATKQQKAFVCNAPQTKVEI